MKIRLSFILTVNLLVLVYSCSSDEPTTSKKIDVPEPIITSLSTDFIIEGENLTINGSNFINSNFSTKLIINNLSYDVIPISNNQISINISNSLGTEKSSVQVQISNKVSEIKEFFIVPKGWYKIELGDTPFYKTFSI